MKKIAITGGIGSGKSTVLSILKSLGYPVFSCDEIYKKVIVDQAYIQQIAAIFPDVIRNGAIDKKLLSEIVFSNAEHRQKLEAIAHPLIMQELDNQMSLSNAEIAFAEVPLLFEGNFQSLFDVIFVLKRAKDTRIEAVKARDNLSATEIEGRMTAQFNYDTLENQEYFQNLHIEFITNDDSVESLKLQILDLIKKLQ